MTIQTDINQKDWTAYRRCLIHRARKCYGLIYWLFVAGVLVAILGTLSLTGIELHAPSFGAGMVVGVMYMVSISLLLGRQLRPAAGGGILGPKQVELTEAGIYVKGQHHESVFGWATIRGAEVTDKHIFVMVDPNAGVIVPRRCFASDTECGQFVSEVRRRSGGLAA